MRRAESFLSVKIVRVDDNERTVQCAKAGKHGLAGSPRLLAAFRNAEPGRNVVHLLEHVLHINILLDTVSDDFTEVLLQVTSCDKYDLIKSGILRGVD